MAESTQHKLDRIRPPRVQITYDVEIGDAMEIKELPFVVGIMADLSGDRDPDHPLPKIKDRKFVEIDRDNFDEVLKAIGPKLRIKGNDLSFQSMEDFEPVNVLLQVEPLRKLFEARSRLLDLMAKLDGNDNLDEKLQDIVDNTDKRTEIKTEIDQREATIAAGNGTAAAVEAAASAAAAADVPGGSGTSANEDASSDDSGDDGDDTNTGA